MNKIGLMLLLFCCNCSNDKSGSEVNDSSMNSTDITNQAMTKFSAQCSDYVGNYSSQVTDVGRSRGFSGKLSIVVDGDKCIFNSNSIPNHNFNDGSDSFPNEVNALNETYQVTISPQVASKVTDLSLSLDNAIFLNGVKLDLLAAACYGVGDEKTGCYKMSQAWRFDPMHAANNFKTDTHNAHAQPDGGYHYHGCPSVLFEDNVKSPVIGFAADGFPIFGPYIEENGTVRKVSSSYKLKEGDRPSGSDSPGGSYDGTYVDDYEYKEGSGDLDECNGRIIDDVYGYYVTDSYPWVLKCFRGTPDSSFQKRM